MNRFTRLMKLFGGKGGKAGVIWMGLHKRHYFTIFEAADELRMSKNTAKKNLEELTDLGIFESKMIAKLD